MGDFAQYLEHAFAEVPRIPELLLESVNGLCRTTHEFADLFLARRSFRVRYLDVTPLFYLMQAVT